MDENLISGLSVDELIQDAGFIETVIGLDEKGWEQFLKLNPSNRENFSKAREIVLIFQVNNVNIDSNIKNNLWEKIKSFSEGNKGGQRRLIPLLANVAAVLFAILAVGSIVYYLNFDQSFQYEFTNSGEIAEQKKTLLVLASGEKVEMKNTQSKISILKEEEIQIENDTIIKSKVLETRKDKVRLTEVIVPYGQKTTLTLNDGTRVWLNAGSRLAFPQKFKKKVRKVYLDGEAYFEVAHNRTKPFIVASKQMNIEVLGTKFNVSSYDTDDFSEAVLLEGSVKVWRQNKLGTQKHILMPNQMASYQMNDKEMVIHTVENPGKMAAWINGWYECQNVELEKVLIKVERYFDVKFIFEKDAISDALPITGKLNLEGSIDDVMYFLSKVSHVNYEINRNEILITKN